MTSKSKGKPRLSGRMLPIMHPDAAGIDIGAEEHLFVLRQSLTAYRFYKHLMAEVDLELEQRMRELPRAEHAPDKRPSGTKKRIYQRAGNEPSFDLKAELFRIAGVDLTDVPGISTLTAHTVLMEVGTDVSRFRNASAFASWLGSVRRSRSVAERSFTPALARSRTEQPSHCDSEPTASITLRIIWETSTAR
jgi:transposase